MKPLGPAKRRQNYIYIGCTEQFDRVDYDQIEDSFIVPNGGRTYFIFNQREYPRVSKPKIIYALFQFFGSKSIKKDPFEELKKYDQVFAIDTNYRDRAVTTAIVGSWSHSRSRLNVRKLYTRLFLQLSSKPEREAWKSLIEEVQSDGALKYALIVDSDLGELNKLNQRAIPIHEGFFLPDNWQINYATSDVRDNFATVRMMRECERGNRRHAAEI